MYLERGLSQAAALGKCKSRLESFYEPVSANGTAASWDNSRPGGRRTQRGGLFDIF
jgi:hypothetical protein